MRHPSAGASRSQAPSGAEALVLSLAEAQPVRVEPRCRHFSQCGGCQLQHIPTDVQIKAKQNAVTSLLTRAGVPNLSAPLTHAAEPWEYRNRVRMRVEDSSVGYNRRGSNAFLPVEECPILSPLLWQAARTAQHMVHAGEARWPAGTEGFELFSNGDEAAIQMSVLLSSTVQTIDRDAPAALRTFAEALRARLPALTGAGLLARAAVDPALSRRVRESARVEVARWGSPKLLYSVRGMQYRVTRGAFFQVNRFLTDTMQSLVVDGRSGRVAWDLYAGAGLFSVPLSRQFQTVVAVEIGQPAAGDLQHALQESGARHRAVHSTVADFLQKQHAGTPPDLIVLDPPRAGLGVDTARLLARAGAAEIVYVSCDADTFARDARALVDSGYTLTLLHLLDLFPQTFHTETVAIFRR